MCNKSISIEYSLFDFFKKNNISYNLIDKMELVWFPHLCKPIII